MWTHHLCNAELPSLNPNPSILCAYTNSCYKTSFSQTRGSQILGAKLLKDKFAVHHPQLPSAIQTSCKYFTPCIPTTSFPHCKLCKYPIPEIIVISTLLTSSDKVPSKLVTLGWYLVQWWRSRARLPRRSIIHARLQVPHVLHRCCCYQPASVSTDLIYKPCSIISHIVVRHHHLSSLAPHRPSSPLDASPLQL